MNNQSIDERLCDVPIPKGVLDGLRAIAGCPSVESELDREIHRLLNEITYPANLTESLHNVVAMECIHEQLVDVPVPADLIARLHAVTFDPATAVVRPSKNVLRRLARWSVAVALMGMLVTLQGLAYLGIAVSLQTEPDDSEQLLIIDHGPLNLDVVSLPPVQLEGPRTPLPKAAEPPSYPGERVAFVDIEGGAPQSGPAGEFLRRTRDGLCVDDDVLLLRWSLLGDRPASVDDSLPDLEIVDLVSPRGHEPPVVPGYDRRFLLREKETPFISPGGHPALRSLAPPLITSAAAIAQLRQAVSANRFPLAAEVREEEFIAALDYRYPEPANNRLGIRTAAGPSIFAPDSSFGMLQIGVQAAPMRRRARPTHLTIAIDLSASMRWERRIDHVVEALQKIQQELTPQDRVSVVVFHEDAVVLAERAPVSMMPEIVEIVGQHSPRGGSNLTLALREAVSTAVVSEENRLRKLVVLSDGRDPLTASVEERAQQMLREATASGLEMLHVDLGRSEEEPPLSRLTRNAGGRIVRQNSADGVRWAVVDWFNGASSVVASNVKLRIEFNPRAVAYYRLVGHRASALAALDRPVYEVELRSREAAAVLLELVVKPTGPQRIGMATVEWDVPGTGGKRRVRQPISRSQFAGSMEESPLSLQAAMIAAEAAEVMRESSFAVSPNRGLRRVLDAAEQVHPRLGERDDFQEFVELLRKLEWIRRRGG
ncbi:MAG: DUF3520 domain-containing protein [Pirellulaceae bacterium]|nr:DUF3520 domain-containing protein [Pirellulaceae bacterium]